MRGSRIFGILAAVGMAVYLEETGVLLPVALSAGLAILALSLLIRRPDPLWPLALLMLSPLGRLASLPAHLEGFASVPAHLLFIVATASTVALSAKRLPQMLGDRRLPYLVALTFFLIFAALGVLRHLSFHSTAYDLAIFDQTLWGYSRGENLFNSVRQNVLLGDHVHPLLFFITPFYWIWPSPLVLIVLQAGAIAAGMLPLSRLARRRLGPEGGGVFALVYALVPTFQYLALADVHPSALIIPFLIWAVDAFDRRRYGLMALLLVVVGMAKEYLPLYLAAGGALVWWRRKRRLGVLLVIGGVVWTVFNLFVVLPAFSATGAYQHVQDGFVQTAVDAVFGDLGAWAVSKAAYLLLLLVPVGFGLFALGSPTVLLAIPDLSILLVFLSVGPEGFIYHHPSRVVAVVLAASVLGLSRFRKRVRTRAMVFLFLSALLAGMVIGPFVVLHDVSSFDAWAPEIRQGKRLLNGVPSDASVAAQNWVLPHLCHREGCYMLDHVIAREAFNQVVPEPEYIVLDVGEANLDPKRSARRMDYQDIQEVLDWPQYGIVDREDDWFLLRRGADHGEGWCSFGVSMPAPLVGRCMG